MRWMRTVLLEIWGLFVDDGSFALSIVIWAALAVVIFRRAAPDAKWAGPLFFVGLAVILAVSALRYARRR
jgi:hypothetical protein